MRAPKRTRAPVTALPQGINIVVFFAYSRAFTVCFPATTTGGRTPLYVAAQNGHLEVVKLLLSRKCSLSAADAMGMLPLHHACAQGRGDVVTYLCAKETAEGGQ